MPYLYEDTVLGSKRNAMDIPSTRPEVLMETFAQAYEENPLKAAQRWLQLRTDQRTGPMISQEDANARIQSYGLKAGDLKIGASGITEAALDTLMFRKRTERRRQETLALSEGGAGETVAKLGVGFATSLVDPISAGLNFVPVVGEARYARAMASAGGAFGRAGVRLATGAVEGAVGAAIAEPLIYAMRTQEQADYDAVDSLLNIAFGGVIGAGLHVTVGGIADGVERIRGKSDIAGPPVREAIDDMNSEGQHAALRAAVGQAVEGRPINVEPIISAAAGNPEVRLIRSEARKALDAEIDRLTAVSKGDDAFLVKIRNDLPETRDRLQDTIKYRDELAATLSESASKQVEAEAQRLARADQLNAYAIERVRESGGGSGAVFPKWRQLAEETVANRRARAAEQQRQAQSVIDTLRSDVDRANKVIAADSYASFLTGARNTAKTVDDLVDLLPEGLRQHMSARLVEARKSGADSGAIAAAEAVDPEVGTAVAAADRTMAESPKGEDLAADMTEQADLAVEEATSLAERLGLKGEDKEFTATLEAVKNSERWARAAELATMCLVRGG